MSQVMNGKYDFSLARWFYTPERQVILDFVDIGTDRGVLALHKGQVRLNVLHRKSFTGEFLKVLKFGHFYQIPSNISISDFLP